MTSKQSDIDAIDLFCGAGGLTNGLLQSGISVRAGFDMDENCRYPFETNNKIPFICEDIKTTSIDRINEIFEDSKITLLAGCAPCQPFSKYTQGMNAKDSDKWCILYEFMRLIKGVKPDLITMENVPQLLKHQVYSDFEDSLNDFGYHVSSQVIFSPDYGVPQTRSRLVLLASKFGEINLIKPTHPPDNYISVRSAISHLDKLNAGEQCAKDPLHKSSSLSELNLKRIKCSKPGGSWQDWDDTLVAECHKKPGRETYSGVYGRMSWDKPSPTITTQFTGFGNGRFGHPSQDRAISLREGALLQTFPNNYLFTSPKNCVPMRHVARMIGNAVPVDLAKAIGFSIKRHLNEQKP